MKMRFVLGFLVLLCGMTGAAWSSAGGNQVEKFALVVGNGSYREKGADLPNAPRDAALIAQSLKTLGFKVTTASDLTRSDFYARIEQFAETIPQGATALFFYAGHGMQIAGSNYLTPVDMTPTSEQSAPLKAFPVQALFERLARTGAAVNIVILDACRNNPFRPQAAVRYRSFSGLGLVRQQAPRGTLLAYSTAPGQAAADGKGENSIYSASLARRLLEPALELEQIFKLTANDVRRRTWDDQIPWYESSLSGAYYFLPPQDVAVLPGQHLARPLTAKEATVQRGHGPTASQEAAWYRQLDEQAWSNLDWEIQQRVKHMTPDEVPELEHKATGGSVLAQTTLGLLYREGVDKGTDFSNGRTFRFKASNRNAVRWLTKAATAGFPIAQTELGEMYYRAHGVARDLTAARYWLEQAATARYPRAKLDLLQLNVEQNPADAALADLLNPVMKSLRLRQ